MYYSGSCCCKISPRISPKAARPAQQFLDVCVVYSSQLAWAVVVIQWFVTPYFFPSLSSPSFYALLFTATVLVSNKKKKSLLLFGDSSYYVVMRGLHYKISPYFYCSTHYWEGHHRRDCGNSIRRSGFSPFILHRMRDSLSKEYLNLLYCTYACTHRCKLIWLRGSCNVGSIPCGAWRTGRLAWLWAELLVNHRPRKL
jgi:hypothetical protein